jgi:hypothetical protein
MTSLILPSRLTRQPQQPTRVNRSNPLANGLMQAFAGIGPYDSASDQVYTTLGTPVYRGNGIEFSTRGAGLKKLATSSEKPSSYTLAILVTSLGAGDSFGSIIGMSYAGNDSNPYGAQVDKDAGNGLRFAFNAGGGAAAIPSSSGGLTAGKPQWVFATFTSGAQALYIDRVQVATGTAVGAPAYGSGSSLNLGQLDGLARNPNCVVHAAFQYSRVLSRGDMDALIANPWQLFAAPQRRMLVSTTSAPVGNSYTLPAAQGSYTITGSAAGLRAARRVTASPGAYTLTGNAATLRAARRLTAAPGAYAITGNAANLIKGTAPKSLQAAAGSYVITGRPAGLRAARRLAAAPGSYAITGFSTGAAISGAIPRFAETTFMRLGVVRCTTTLGPDRIQRTLGFP